jgi:hypothetical protein
VAWRQSRSSFAWEEQRNTSRELVTIGEAINAYVRNSNACPSTIEQLWLMTNEVPDIEYYFSRELLDQWGNLLVLSQDDTNCIVTSYGRDGKPGGIGIDCDLTSKTPLPKKSIPTFGQYWHNPRANDQIRWCFICGFMATFLSLLTVRIPNLTPRGMTVLGISLVMTLIGTVFVAIMITGLHVPSGH